MKALVVAAVLAALAAGCARTESEIATTVEAYERALRERDVATVCTLVVPREIATPDGELALDAAIRACRADFDEASFTEFGGVGLELEDAQVTGGRARVAIRTSDGRRIGLEMARLADRWRIVRPSRP